LLLTPALMGACSESGSPSQEIWDYPERFGPPLIPDDNPQTDEKIELGRKLFFDPVLSRNRNLACASCHLPEHGFADTAALSKGFHGRSGERNAPALMNLAWRSRFNLDGGVRSIELQVLVPLLDSTEMASTTPWVIERLRADPDYVDLFQKAFGRLPDDFGLVRALAAYERTLVHYGSPHDRFEEGDTAALSLAARRGRALFYGPESQCSSCHSGVFLTDQDYHRLLPADPRDDGRARITLDRNDRGQFHTPSLRNVRNTAPYFHDGRFSTLREVVDFYAQGGVSMPDSLPGDPRIRPLPWSEQDKVDLVAFLEAL